MAISNRYIFYQGPVILGLLKTAARAVNQRLLGPDPRRSNTLPKTPGPVLRRTIKPRPAQLLSAYMRHLGADLEDHPDTLPPHLFPQWGLPLSMQALAQIPYPLMRIVNGGCRMEINAALPANTPLEASAQLLDIDDNGRRAVLHTQITTGTAETPEALVAHLYWIVAYAKNTDKKEANGAKNTATQASPKKRVPDQARELERWYLPTHSGLDFARLTGDFNPIHWVPPHARAFGFKNVILHGFEAQARVFEALTRELSRTDEAIAALDVQFTRPLTLPAEVGVYLADDTVYVGKAPGTRAYLVGSFEKRDTSISA